MTNNRGEIWPYYFEMNVVELLNRMVYHKERDRYERQKNGKRV